MKKQHQSITRRDFLKETAGGAGILAVGSGSFAASIGLGRAASAGKETIFRQMMLYDPVFRRLDAQRDVPACGH